MSSNGKDLGFSIRGSEFNSPHAYHNLCFIGESTKGMSPIFGIGVRKPLGGSSPSSPSILFRNSVIDSTKLFESLSIGLNPVSGTIFYKLNHSISKEHFAFKCFKEKEYVHE